ncbi:sugar ABC transporter substrate-binding protein [Spirochaetia bacterium]|nr:sugar ABC transporter substrate-binding protein [Spirochaetia bacterium]
MIAATPLSIWASGNNDSGSKVTTIEFAQWWAPEMPAGSLEKVIAGFEAKNPDIKVKLISNPTGEHQQWVTVAAASGTLSDVVAVEPALMDSMVKQNVIMSLEDLIKRDNFNLDQLASIPRVDGKIWLFQVATFFYPLFYNTDLFKAAGIANPPRTHSEFIDACAKLTDPARNVYGWSFPMTVNPPFGSQNQILAWLWASQKSAFQNGKPNINTPDAAVVYNMLKTIYDRKIINPGSLTKSEPEEMEEFANGNAAMMFGSIAHINPIHERNPNLNYALAPVPVADNYTGKPGICYAAWGVGIAPNSKHKDEAWRLVQYLVSPEANAAIAQSSNSFPGNKNAKPDYSAADPHFAEAFRVFQQVDLKNELIGANNVWNLVTIMAEEIHGLLEGKQTTAMTLANTQERWLEEYK